MPPLAWALFSCQCACKIKKKLLYYVDGCEVVLSLSWYRAECIVLYLVLSLSSRM